MGYEVTWTEPASADLDAIVAQVATSSPQASGRLGDAIVAHVERLGTFPTLGAPYPPGSRGNLRETAYRKYRIFYRVHETERRVEVITIWHGARREPTGLE